MKKMIKFFALAIVSTVVLTLFLGMASAKPVPQALTVTLGPNFNPELIIDGKTFTCTVENPGNTPVAKFQLVITDGTITYWWTHSTWSLTASGNTATWQANERKYAIKRNGIAGFTLDWVGDWPTGFTANWYGYDWRGDLIDAGTLSWHYP